MRASETRLLFCPGKLVLPYKRVGRKKRLYVFVFKLLVFSHPVMVPLTDLFVYRLLGVNT